MIEKLGKIKASLDDTVANENRDARIGECVDILRSLGTVSFLTTRDVEKAEGMLRYIYEK